MFVQDLILFFSTWFSTRRWRPILLLAGPLVLSLAAMCCPTLFGWLRSHDELVSEYMALAERNIGETEVPAGAGNKDELDVLFEGDGRLTPIASLAFRRVLRLEPNNRASYAVARYLASVGNTANADQMMRRIAPTNRKGYGPAHAWIAERRIAASRSLTNVEIEALSNDLAAACDSSVTSESLVQAYANVLVLQQKSDAAKELLTQYLEKYPRLNVTLAEIASDEGDDRTFRLAADLAKRLLVESIGDSTNCTVADFIDLSLLYGKEGELDKAIKVGNVGLQKALATSEDTSDSRKNEARMRRVLAMAYLQKYISSALAKSPSRSEVQLEYLDLAVRVDPTYPEAISEVARIVVQGREATPEMVSKLQSSLAQGTAAATTHMLLANYLLENEQPDQAIPHLEQALEIQPDHPIALNNLAYALLNQQESLPRALELIEHGLQVARDMPAIRASMLDSRGTIQSQMGEHRASINSFLSAIRLAPRKLTTHKKLANAYEAVGMIDMASAQLNRIEVVRIQIEEERGDKQNPKDERPSGASDRS